MQIKPWEYRTWAGIAYVSGPALSSGDTELDELRVKLYKDNHIAWQPLAELLPLPALFPFAGRFQALPAETPGCSLA